MRKYVIGIDEAGRGPIAGPVAVGGVCIPVKYLPKLKKIFLPIKGKDSKKLSEKSRAEWFEKIKQMESDGLLQYTVALTSSKVIDEKGIVNAIRRSMKRVLHKIGENPSESFVQLDGGLYASSKYVHQETIIKGDEKVLAISLASICAKVIRDRKMLRMSAIYPEYGFSQHKGYGTKMHYERIKQNGMSKEHRKSFLRNI